MCDMLTWFDLYSISNILKNTDPSKEISTQAHYGWASSA